MMPLEKEEIMEGLNRLGISNPAERAVCFNEYREYCGHSDCKSIKRLFRRFSTSMTSFIQKGYCISFKILL